MSSVHSAIARVFALLAFVCGTIGLIAGLTGHFWKFGPVGWFSGGMLLAVIGLFVQADSAKALPKNKE
jgi:hypothetical protein